MRNLMRLTAVVVLFAMQTAVHAQDITIYADSIDDWSVDGIQGENNWFNGYYNLTQDDDGVYAAADFMPFINDDSFEVWEDGENHWDGNVWRLYRDTADTGGNTGPWTRIHQNGGHPNGTNSAPPFSVDDSEPEEHWPIRRWVSNMAGDATLVSTLAAANTNCGSGTSTEVYHNGALVVGSSIATQGPEVQSLVQVTLAEGDVIDFALSPAGVDGDRADGCDGSNFHLQINNQQPPAPPRTPYADSLADWSSTGTQGENNWFNGYYNLTLDDDGSYQVADFMPFTNDAGPDGGDVELDGNHWTGTQWDINASGGPWTSLGSSATHPNGTNSAPNEEHWTIRRYVASDLAGSTPLELNWQMAKTNLNNDGVTGKLFVNGEEVDSVTIAGNDGAGVNRSFYLNVNPGDVIDLALTPVGVTNDTDGSDGSRNQLTIHNELPDGPLYNPGETVADSSSEFSGEQGQDGWFYGIYDQRLDVEEGDGVYGVEDFEALLNDGSGDIWDDPPTWRDGENHWNGSKWDIVDNPLVSQGPWAEVTAGGGHPSANAQGDPEVHWAVRRWVSDVEGEYVISGTLQNGSANGDGTMGRIFLDGEEVWAAPTDGDSVEVEYTIQLQEGSILDFAIDADGAENFDPEDPFTIDAVNDGSDSTTFAVTIGSVNLFEPGGGMPGDYNSDGSVDVLDIDLQAAAINAANPDLGVFDENSDGVVDINDREIWVAEHKGTWMGDSDFNGQFNSSDLVIVFTGGKYESGAAASWADGDWNGDGFFGSSDLVTAFIDGGYEAGARGAVNAVPEPSSLVLLVLAAMSLLSFRRRA